MDIVLDNDQEVAVTDAARRLNVGREFIATLAVHLVEEGFDYFDAHDLVWTWRDTYEVAA